MRPLNTGRLSAELRSRSFDPDGRRLLITNYVGSEQERDLSEPPNCGGFGRIRHFRRATSAGWPSNPLPIDPACRALGLPATDVLRAQAFQNAACNWRCWYCYVPFDLLAAKQEYSGWLSAGELVDLYLAEPDRSTVIDLTGGQPDLTPEWVPWVMEALESRGLGDSVYLWSDDNLSNDYFWRYLTAQDHERVARYRMYGRVCCFKGFDANSFAFNTRADTSLFDQQFALMNRLLDLGIDLYAYATFTAPSPAGIPDAMARFVDRLQALDPNLPLRTVPLEIRVFTPVEKRMDSIKAGAIAHQQAAIEAWNYELERRFASSERERNVVDVSLRGRTRA